MLFREDLLVGGVNGNYYASANDAGKVYSVLEIEGTQIIRNCYNFKGRSLRGNEGDVRKN